MASMLFANIPTDGSGSRPLEADLYGAEQQNVDAENISATGNLNIGNVVDYDAHIQRLATGGAAKAEEAPQTFPIFNDPAADGLITSNGINRAVNYTGDNYNNTSPVQAEPNAPANQAIVNSAAAAAAPPVANAGNDGRNGVDADVPDGGLPGGGSSSETTTTTSDSHNVTTTDSHNTYNYTYNTTTTTNNNSSLIDIDNTTGGTTDTVGGLLEQVVHVAGDTLNSTTELLGDTLNNVLGGGTGNGLLAQVTALADTTLTGVGDTVNSLLNPTNGDGLLTQVTTLVDTTLDTVTGLLGGGTGDSVGDGLQTILGDVNNVLTGEATPTELVNNLVHDATNILEPVTDGLPVLGTVADGLEHVTAGLDGLLGGSTPLLDVQGVILGDATSAANDHALINADLGILAPDNGAPHAAGLGIVDADLSLLSTPTAGVEGIDGASVAVNLNPVTQMLLPETTVPTITVDIPLPSLAPAVPLSTGADLLHTLGSELASATQVDTLLDQVGSLLGNNAGSPVDAGNLFANSHGAGVDSGTGSGAGTPAVPAIHLDLAHGLFQHA